MDQNWILQKKETHRTFSKSTWVPLRASINDEQGNSQYTGYVSEYFGCGSVGFPPEHREKAEKANWTDIGIGCTPFNPMLTKMVILLLLNITNGMTKIQSEFTLFLKSRGSE